jgi:hypothetical protein
LDTIGKAYNGEVAKNGEKCLEMPKTEHVLTRFVTSLPWFNGLCLVSAPRHTPGFLLASTPAKAHGLITRGGFSAFPYHCGVGIFTEKCRPV